MQLGDTAVLGSWSNGIIPSAVRHIRTGGLLISPVRRESSVPGHSSRVGDDNEVADQRWPFGARCPSGVEEILVSRNILWTLYQISLPPDRASGRFNQERLR